MSTTLAGIGVSSGAAHAPIVRAGAAPRPPAGEKALPEGEAQAVIEKALADVAAELEKRAARADEQGAEVLNATVMLAKDPSLLQNAVNYANSGQGPATAIDRATAEFVDQFTALGGYFAERSTDVRDVGDRAIAAVLGVPAPGVPEFTEPSVVVAHDLAPAETAVLDRSLVAAIVTSAGGRTSHTAILAAQMGIPAVVQAAGILEVEPGTEVLVDGEAGTVEIEPAEDTVATAIARIERRAKALEGCEGPGLTKDGHPVALLANIGGVADAEEAGPQDVEGVGLFRTEFVFLSASTAPTVEEQTEIYTKVFAPFGTRRVVVRTLDAGADKPLAFANLGEEENPALGVRGMRLSEALPELIDTQLEALANAEQATDADVWVMAPMVGTVEEAQWFASTARSKGLTKVGIMVEVPAAALRSPDLLGEVDFGSIGTNDLAQYTMAADRMAGGLSHLLDPWQPAVFDLVAATCKGAVAHEKSMGVCGESGGDPLIALVLAGLGVTSLSMAPSKVPFVRYALSLHTHDDCVAIAEAARNAPTAKAAMEAARAKAHPDLLDIL